MVLNKSPGLSCSWQVYRRLSVDVKKTASVLTWGPGHALSLHSGQTSLAHPRSPSICQVKQPQTNLSVTHSLKHSLCIYSEVFFTYTHMCMWVYMHKCWLVFMWIYDHACVLEQQVLVWQRSETRVRLLSPCNQSRHAPSLHLHFQREGAPWLAVESVIRPYCLRVNRRRTWIVCK